MNVIQTKHIEDCFDGSYVYELSFSEPITESFIVSMSAGSVMQYFSDFSRPFFRIIDSDFMIKGVEGSRMLRIISYQAFEKTLETINQRINQHLSKLNRKETQWVND